MQLCTLSKIKRLFDQSPQSVSMTMYVYLQLYFLHNVTIDLKKKKHLIKKKRQRTRLKWLNFIRRFNFFLTSIENNWC